MAYIFSRKIPKQEREDLFQDIALKLIEADTPEQRLAYAIARCDWQPGIPAIWRVFPSILALTFPPKTDTRKMLEIW
jgi:hypothetical protein